MTENKRFTLAYEDYDWWAICDKENPTELGISGLDVVELLNELHEENRELQRHLDVMRSGALTDDKRIKELYNENEELKNAIIGKIQYGEDLEKFAIEKGLIQEDWARFDDYD